MSAANPYLGTDYDRLRRSLRDRVAAARLEPELRGVHYDEAALIEEALGFEPDGVEVGAVEVDLVDDEDPDAVRVALVERFPGGLADRYAVATYRLDLAEGEAVRRRVEWVVDSSILPAVEARCALVHPAYREALQRADGLADEAVDAAIARFWADAADAAAEARAEDGPPGRFGR